VLVRKQLITLPPLPVTGTLSRYRRCEQQAASYSGRM